MGILEIIVLLFCVFALSRVVLRWRSGEVTAREAAFWVVIWLAIIAVVLLQSQLQLLGNMFDSRRPVDILIYGSILLLFYLVFRIYVKLDNLTAEITTVVRQRTLVGIKRRR